MIAILGVTFGISMFIIMSGVMDGTNQLLEDTQFKTTPHIRLYNESKAIRPPVLSVVYDSLHTLLSVAHQRPRAAQEKIRQAAAIMESLRQLPEVKGITAHVTSSVVFNYGATKISGTLSGVNIRDEDHLFGIHTKMKSGNMDDLLRTSNGVIMGKGLAEKMNLHTGDHITVTSPDGAFLNLKVTGIFSLGMGNIDNVKSYVNFNSAQQMLRKDAAYITEIVVQLYEPDKASILAPVMQQRYGCIVEDWETANQTLMAGNKIRSMMKYVVSFTLLTVAGFGIYNIMNMTILNKMKDIAIMKATGFSGKDVKRIFLFQSLAVGIIGAILGLSLGWLICSWMVRMPFNGGEYMDITHLPVAFKPSAYITGLVFGVITTFLAAWFPSKRASKIDPVEILRG
ncbi:lipoprotein-releasing system permease protein [Chitinophaga niastensis]|uniref:Lipoprotein-releasing system permease protein n=2 Tax=Chitinophaga niastensis TaxID=536980 RepID=A0A2P8HDP7_CHINA|nr:lipoprotein-releasing system permease protein [Chitinophaga niastensis]